MLETKPIRAPRWEPREQRERHAERAEGVQRVVLPSREIEVEALERVPAADAGVVDDDIDGLVRFERSIERFADLVAANVDALEHATPDSVELRRTEAAGGDHRVAARMELPGQLEPDPAVRARHEPGGHRLSLPTRLRAVRQRDEPDVALEAEPTPTDSSSGRPAVLKVDRRRCPERGPLGSHGNGGTGC